jgi:hypothetical protein
MIKKEWIFLCFILLFFLGVFKSVVAVPYLGENCSDSELIKIWDSVFIENSSGINITKWETSEYCSYSIIKNKLNESYFLEGYIHKNFSNYFEAWHIFLNTSKEGFEYPNSVGGGIVFSAKRNIKNSSEAKTEFEKTFKESGSGEWIYSEDIYNTYKIIYYTGANFSGKSGKVIYENLSVNLWYLNNSIATIPEEGLPEDSSSGNESNLSFTGKIGDMFVLRGGELTFNVKIYLKNPENLGVLEYRVSGLRNASVSFKGDLMTIKWDKNYNSVERVKLYVDDGIKEIGSNEFFIFPKEENELSGGEPEKESGENLSEIINNSIKVSENKSLEGLDIEEDSFNWLILVIIISSVILLIIILIILYFLFIKKDETEENLGSQQVDEYVKGLGFK